MRIDQKLNLVIPIEREGGTIYVHSTPISPEVFETYFLEISKAFAAIFQQGLGIHAGPRVAYMMLKRIAEASKTWEGDVGVETGLMNEIRRLSNVIMPTETGWKPIPLEDALSRKLLDPEDISEAEGAIVFFHLGLGHGPARGSAGNAQGGLWSVENAGRIVELYGLRRFLGDIDRDRAFCRDSEGLVAALLDWAANEGFEQMVGQYTGFESPHEFRQRHILNALARRGPL